MENSEYGRWLKPLPRFPRRLIRHLVDPHAEAIEEFIRNGSALVPAGGKVLDAGAGESPYKVYFPHAHYVGVDSAIGQARWDYSLLDVRADLLALPFRDLAFDLGISTQVLEHVREPKALLAELFRVLKPGGRLLLTAPQGWYEHQTPHDYFRFTSFALRYLLEKAGFKVEELEPIGGYFWYLGHRIGHLPKVLFPAHRSQAQRILFFPLEALTFILFAGLIPMIVGSLDILDQERWATLGYRCLARKP